MGILLAFGIHMLIYIPIVPSHLHSRSASLPTQAMTAKAWVIASILIHEVPKKIRWSSGKPWPLIHLRHFLRPHILSMEFATDWDLTVGTARKFTRHYGSLLMWFKQQKPNGAPPHPKEYYTQIMRGGPLFSTGSNCFDAPGNWFLLLLVPRNTLATVSSCFKWLFVLVSLICW